MKIFHNKSLNNFIPPIFFSYDVMEAYKSSELGMRVRFPLSLLYQDGVVWEIHEPHNLKSVGSNPTPDIQGEPEQLKPC